MRDSDRSRRILPRATARSLAAPAVLAALLAVLAPGATAAGGPVPNARPTVSGHATEGDTLAVSKGRWTGSGRVRFSYRWYRCDTMGAHCQILRGVNRRSHRLGVNDVGHTLSVAVHATDDNGAATAFASLVGPVAGKPAGLVSLSQPRISGTAVQGSSLKVGTGGWRPRPASFSYQWVRCNLALRACATIAGATADSHDVAADDLGHVLVAIVQARSGKLARAVFSAASAVAVAEGQSPEPTSTPQPAPAQPAPAKPSPAPQQPAGGAGPAAKAQPSVAQLVESGGRLVGDTGAWSGSGAITFTYNWYRCDAAGAHCLSVHGATRPAYELGDKDVGHTLGFAVHATDRTGTATAYASLVGPVAPAGAPLVSLGQPPISGNAAVGQTLQVANGAWTQTPGSFSYQWQRCNANGRLCAPIAGATGAGYTVTAADGGHALLAVVHAVAGTASQDALSAASAPVGAGATATATATAPPAPGAGGPSLTAAPGASGTAQQGSQLTGTPGSWTGAGTVSYTFNWFRCDAAGAHCLSVHGATRPTFTLGAKDVGHTLGFAVHAADSAGTATAYASLVGPIAAGDSPLASTAPPAISGNAAQGQTLQVSTGSWTQTPSTLTYQWERCNANGRLCTAIDGATGSSYTVGAADAAHTLVAVVHAVAGTAAQDALAGHTGTVP